MLDDDNQLEEFGYQVVPEKTHIVDNSILLFLQQEHCQSIFFATEVTLSMTFYQDGIVRFHIDEHLSPLQRFRVSSIEGVVDE